MLHRYMQAIFLIKHGKFRRHASKSHTEHSCSIKHIVKIKHIIFEKIDFFGRIVYWRIHQNKLALSLCEPIHNPSDPKKSSTHIIRQFVFFLQIPYSLNSRLLVLTLGQLNSFFVNISMYSQNRTLFSQNNRKVPEMNVSMSHIEKIREE